MTGIITGTAPNGNGSDMQQWQFYTMVSKQGILMDTAGNQYWRSYYLVFK